MKWEEVEFCNYCGSKDLKGQRTNHQLFDRRVSFSECSRCGLMFTNPRPNLDEYFSLFATGVMGGKAYQMLFLEKISFRGLLDRILSHSSNCSRLFDMGCGLGILLREAERRGITAEGNDVNLYSYNYAKKKGLKVILAPTHKLQLPENIYDVVTMKSYLAHSPFPYSDIRLAHKALRKGGLLFIREALLENPKNLHHEEIELDHFTFLRLSTLRAMLKSAGFGIVGTRRITPARRVYGGKVDIYAKA